ncbi:hypothetical protein ACOMICROBIO_GDFFDHBD_02493 [Vibrio sp. B1REV9]|uniref:COR domain-containing protein n=1 Tax=Vibrio sp. B1REV9 TaxID=2751179 RepID=UPI001AF641B6|nr:COR domain-containing protein [Vibrio sp. B1REV9]CAE6929310.1 hypothetical protein ACOMICROBIO_GDFFDHBD_02493 [Vibrio sp. B1REV9]
MSKHNSVPIELPEIDKKTIEELRVFLSYLYGSEFSINPIDVDLNDFHNLSTIVETNFEHEYCIKVINECFLSIEGHQLKEEPIPNELLIWIEDRDLSRQLAYISGQFTEINIIRNFCNLVSLNLCKIPSIKTTFTSQQNPFPLLKEVNLDTITDTHLTILGDSIKNVEALQIESDDVKSISAKNINLFSDIKQLQISSIIIDDIHNLTLPALEVIYTQQILNLNDLDGCRNLQFLAASLDTSNPQIKGPAITELSTGKHSSSPINLKNINTSQLRSIYVSNGVELEINSLIPSLKQLHDRSRTDDFKLSSLTYLPNINSLTLNKTNIILDIESNWTHNSLRNLSISGSNLDNLSFINSFPNLESLIVPANKINSIEPVLYLAHLKYLNIQYNNIIDIPRALAEKFKLVVENRHFSERIENVIQLRGNPLISPPIEIIERGEDAIKPYFQSMIGETEELNEAKIVFLGNGEVGKTSLMKALNGQLFDAEENTTHGININKYTVPINDRHSVDASIWDFGGQQIMHATHQLFLSRRCVYVLVINDRKEDLHQEQKIDYWLQQVQTFGGNSKVIIVRNKSDMFTFNNIPEGKLKEKYPNLVAIESVSCKTRENIKRVRDLINQQVRHLPMRKVRLAQNWITVKDQIKALSHERDHLPLSQFSDICNANGVTDFDAQMTLRNLLHDLSVVIAFEELDGFDMGILSPHWITDGIYTLINSKFLEGKKGYIKLADVQQELDKAFPGKYVNKARFIIESMIQFELCHRVGSAKNGTYLVPNLLPKEIKSKKIQQKGNTINFIFKYDNLLPPSIIPNFLVRMSHQISDDKRWRTGAIMTDTGLGVQALVEEYTVERELRITVSGQQARDYFSVIRHEIRKLNEPNTKALGVRELVPLNDNRTEFVDYDELIGLEVMGKSTYTSGKLKEEFSVVQLLSGIESREETENSVAKQKQSEGINVSVEVKQGDIRVTTGDVINNISSSTSSEQSQVATQSQQVDIKIDLKSLKGTADYVLEDLKSDAEDEIVNELDRDRFIKECNRVQNAISEIEQIGENEKDASDKTGHFMRVRDFLNNALDKVGPVGEAVDSLGGNITKIRDMAKKYNTVASHFGLPVVPEILLF